MNYKWKKWLGRLANTVLNSVAHAVIVIVGAPVANLAGANIPIFDWKQVGIVALSGAVLGTANYVLKEPPPLEPDEPTPSP